MNSRFVSTEPNKMAAHKEMIEELVTVLIHHQINQTAVCVSVCVAADKGDQVPAQPCHWGT